MALAGAAGAETSSAAQRLRLAALDQEAELRVDSAIALLRRAVAAEPAWLPAWYDYLRLTYETGAEHRLRAELARPPTGSGAIGRCVQVVAQNLGSGWPLLARAGVDALREQDRREPNACAALFVAANSAPQSTLPRPADERLRLARRAVELQPELGATWVTELSVLLAENRVDDAAAAAARARRQPLHSLETLLLYGILAAHLEQNEQAAKARPLRQRLNAAVARDGRPGLRYLWSSFSPPGGDGLAPLRRQLAIARAHGAWTRVSATLHELGHLTLDRGDPSAALRYHDEEVALAERAGSPRLRLMAYARRGRALSKLGRLEEAAQELTRAIALRPHVRDDYFIMEAYHNLAHVHESAARWGDAARAARRYVELAAHTSNSGLRVVSRHDAATIYWKAGWHGAAEAEFQAMVREIDAHRNEYFWAGEYYERIGELERAVAYYRRAVQGNTDPSLALEALARVYATLGFPDSAESAARRHDAMRAVWQPLEQPLLPHVLAERGRTAEAVALSRAWAQRQLDNRNVHGATVAVLQLAELLLAAGDPVGAEREAQRATELAREYNLTAELGRALRISGTAAVKRGAHAAGIARLRAAVAQAQRHPAAGDAVAGRLALADALAATAQAPEALRAYDAAAVAVERVTRMLASDLNRTSFRARNLAPYDGAVRVLVRMPPGRIRTERLLHWSIRRKGASLRLALAQAGFQLGAARAQADVAALQRALGDDEALLDYVLTGDVAAVIVLTRRSARVVPLPTTRDSVGARVERLRRRLVPRNGQAVDLARARFDYTTADSLYRSVLAPALTELRGVRRLLVAPDGPLHYLPLEALPLNVATPAPARELATRFVIDRFEVVYVPSAQAALRAGRNLALRAPRVLVIAGNAPAADAEADAVATALTRARVALLAGGAASESALRRAAPTPDVLHIAAHARADGRDPLASHLRLAADSAHDGYLHVSEIAAHRSPHRLVVLSACDSGTGSLYEGEGLFGLARAFLLAGSESVVASHWPVGASNVELMRAFYAELDAGVPPATALRRARLTLRRSPATAHPLFWAGQVLVSAG